MKWWSHAIQALIGVGMIGALIQTGRILERLDQVEELAADYAQNQLMQGTVSRAEYMELLRIHMKAGDIE